MDEKTILGKIAKTSKIIREKHKAMKNNKVILQEKLNETFKPIVDPLKKLVDKTEYEEDVTDDEEEHDTSIHDESSKKRKKTHFTTSTPNRMFMKKKKRKSYAELTDQPLAVSHIPQLVGGGEEENTVHSMEPATPIRRAQLVTSQPSADLPPLPPLPTSQFPTSPLPTPSLVESFSSPLGISVREILTTTEDEINHALQKTTFGPISEHYIRLLVTDTANKMDNVYGVYLKGNKLMIGNKNFEIDRNDNLMVGDTRYRGTKGLFELIFMKVPEKGIYNAQDLVTYKEILHSTLAHMKNHSANTQVLGNKGYKYKDIIAPMLKVGQRNVQRQRNTQGCGLERKMIVNNAPIEYVHWDDPNELVERLKLLVASQDAGHTSHDNEIQSILEELREVGLIV